MSDEKIKQNTEIQEIQKTKKPLRTNDSEIRHNYEIGEQRSQNFSLQFKTKDTTPPTVTTNSTEEE